MSRERVVPSLLVPLKDGTTYELRPGAIVQGRSSGGPVIVERIRVNERGDWCLDCRVEGNRFYVELIPSWDLAGIYVETERQLALL